MRSHFLSALLVLAAIYPATSFSVELKGTGRVVPGELLAEWGVRYVAQNPGSTLTVKYQGINRTEGIKQVEADVVDFTDTEMPLSKEELEKKGLSQFPYMLTAITPVVNLPGVFEGQLNLSGKILSDIFLGKIKKWDDPAIVAINRAVKLPNNNILVAHQATDGDGTFTLSSYLAKVDPEWQSSMGVGVTLNWPVGVAVENMAAMSNYVKNTPYSIGYSEIAYARKNQLVYVRLQNSTGAFISPHMGSVEEAVHSVHWTAASGFTESLTNQPGDRSWPMSSASYIVIKKTSANIERRTALLSFLGWGLRVGAVEVVRHDFLPIKRTLLPLIRNSWNDSPLSLEGSIMVNAEQVRELMGNGVPIIDARISSEYEAEHIPKAHSVPYGEKSAKAANFNALKDSFDLSQLPSDKSAAIIFYCNAGACWRSYKAATVAIRAGYKKVYWLRGGLPEWKEKGYPTESALPPAAK